VAFCHFPALVACEEIARLTDRQSRNATGGVPYRFQHRHLFLRCCLTLSVVASATSIMCVIVTAYRCTAGVPLVVGANREEAYIRGGTEPALQEDRIPFVAGLDPLAGGTWLGVNAAGVLVAVTNRPKSYLPPKPRSRGLLVRDLLTSESAAAGVKLATKELGAGGYAGCNLLCADQEQATIIHAGDWLRVRPLPPGLHVITTGDVDDDGDARIRYAFEWFTPERLPSGTAVLAGLREFLSHSGSPAPISFDAGERGTVSSTIIALKESLTDSTLLHAQGSPARTPFADQSELLRKLAALVPSKEKG
jgi:hypothetical protein